MLNPFIRDQLNVGLIVLTLTFSSVGFAENQSELLGRGYEALSNGDYEQSFRAFDRLAKQDLPEAHFVLALFYKEGWGLIDQDIKKSCDSFLIAAELGIPKAQQEYGFCVIKRESTSTNESPSYWFELAFEHGIYEAGCDIGRLYLGTEWKEPNVEKAISWCQRAAERSSVKAQVTLGDIYISNAEVFDVEQAEFWYQQAINIGSGEAAFKLATLYLKVVDLDKGNDHISQKVLYLMEVASSQRVERAYSATAKLYWKKLQNSEQDVSTILSKAYLWAKTAYLVNPNRDNKHLLGEIENEMPNQWKSKLDLQVDEFLGGQKR